MSNDPRVQPWAYVTDGSGLFEVVKHEGIYSVTLENCRSGQHISVSELGVFKHYRLVRAAPETVVV